MNITRRTALSGIAAGGLLSTLPAVAQPRPMTDLSPANWPERDRRQYWAMQGTDRTRAGSATGRNGAVTVAYGAFAARAGHEALKQGGTAMDAALTTAMAQIALTTGAPVSYFGILSLVYHEARTGRTYSLNAEWNTVRGETDPRTIPGSIGFADGEMALQGPPSGRTALVGGFMKGVEAGHRRFGRLPFASLFDPSIYIAEQGMTVTPMLDMFFRLREADFRRLPATAATMLKPDGSRYGLGETFRQPQLAETLRRVATYGSGYMYGGEWGRRLIAAVQADGGRMTLDDLLAYEPQWSNTIEAPLFSGWSVRTAPSPNGGGIALIEGQNLAEAAGLCSAPHWTESSDSLKKALDITQMVGAGYLPPSVIAQIYPGLDFSPENRITKAHAEALWARIAGGAILGNWAPRPRSSDDVVAVDAEGNIAALTHTINTIYWGKTAIMVDGVSIGDPASYQQAQIAAITPGRRLPAPSEQGVLFRDGRPVMGFASMGSGLHQRTFQGLLNTMCHGMTVEEAINTPDFFFPSTGADGSTTVVVPEGRFSHAVLDGTGYAWREAPNARARLEGEGKWVAISRDPRTRRLHAASHNRSNSAAVAY
jgi:gamma-glutamyltranspeptidase / glutathione hydrolase